MCFCLDGVYIHGLCSSGESYNEECMTGGRSGGFACGAGRRRRRLGWPWCSAAVFVLSWDVPGQSRQRAQVQVIMLGTWYDNFLEGRGAPQPALHGGNRHASHRASALTWLPNGFPQATHIFVVQVAHVQRGMTFTWYCLLFAPQLVHGGNEHVLHQVVAALFSSGCPTAGLTAHTAQVQLGMTTHGIVCCLDENIHNLYMECFAQVSVAALFSSEARLDCTHGTSPARHLHMVLFAVWTRTATTSTWRKRTCFAPRVGGSSVVEGLSTLTAGLHCTNGTSPARHSFHMVLFAFWTRTSTTCTCRKRTCFAPRVCGGSVL